MLLCPIGEERAAFSGKIRRPGCQVVGKTGKDTDRMGCPIPGLGSFRNPGAVRPNMVHFVDSAGAAGVVPEPAAGARMAGLLRAAAVVSRSLRARPVGQAGGEVRSRGGAGDCGAPDDRCCVTGSDSGRGARGGRNRRVSRRRHRGGRSHRLQAGGRGLFRRGPFRWPRPGGGASRRRPFPRSCRIRRRRRGRSGQRAGRGGSRSFRQPRCEERCTWPGDHGARRS
jgi:hypothetical protein